MPRKKSVKKSSKENKKLYSILVRYVLAIILALKNLWIFYAIFTPLTVFPVAFLLKIFYEVTISSPYLFINGCQIEIVRACVAGAAYYFLLLLNLLTPIGFKKRIKVLVFSFVLLWILNILRIFILVMIYPSEYFDITHKIFWYGLSTIFVVVIWLLAIKIYKIKTIPFYSDFKYINNLRKKGIKKKSK